jgi:hypothetical protein
MKMKGIITFENDRFKFSSDTKILNFEIGYVKSEKNIGDDSLINYYPITIFLLEKLSEEQTICTIETKNGEPILHDNKLILLL